MRATYSRRDFIAAVAGTSAAMVLRTCRTQAADDVDPRVAELVASTIGVDTHNHVDVPMTSAEVPGPNLDIAGELKRSGLSAICATFAVDRQNIGGPGVAYDRFQNAMKSMDAQLARNHMKRALNFKDLQAAHDNHQPVIVQAGTDRLKVTHPDRLKVTHLGPEYGRSGQERQVDFYSDFRPFFCFIDSRKR